MRFVEDGTPEDILDRYADNLSRSFPFSFHALIESLAALICLAALSPLMLAVCVGTWLKDRSQVLYKGLRLGFNKDVFYMYKFRTLPPGYQKEDGGGLTDPDQRRIGIWFRFLRDSRMDELPQLFNILRGEMRFIGPRPVRPEQYEQLCADIRHFDIRFRVRPGLIGYSQVFTPHDAPRRIRSRIDNRFVLKNPGFFCSCSLMAYTLYRLAGINVTRFFSSFRLFVKQEHGFSLLIENRSEKRVYPKDARVLIRCDDDIESDWRYSGDLIDINRRFLRMKILDDPPRSVLQLKLKISNLKNNKNRYIRCQGKIVREYGKIDGRNVFVCEYRPCDHFQAYLLDQYVFCKSIAKRCAAR